MTYTLETTIHVSLETFMKKFNNPENLKHWQRNIVAYDFITGVYGQTGSKMRLHYRINDKDFYFIQTMSHVSLPHELDMSFQNEGVVSFQKNQFKAISDTKTLWISENTIVPTSLKMRLMLIFMPNAFKKQSKQYFNDFKNFAEHDISVNNQNSK
ncbi:SRPBCC family protein [Bizionia sediminis]|uniref:SRPBCC family protein n=1 Tax=Bizionia sediminis TaxID=1737064 RepID=A0ABW5KUG2_9FLAO